MLVMVALLLSSLTAASREYQLQSECVAADYKEEMRWQKFY